MSVPLGDALQNVELKIGRTYRCEVNGRWVELRVLAERPHRAEPMFDPWVEFPLQIFPMTLESFCASIPAHASLPFGPSRLPTQIFDRIKEEPLSTRIP